MNLYKGYCTQIYGTCQVSEKKQINIDQIVQQYTHLHEEGYSIDDRVTKLAELYYKSRVLPIQVIDNLFGQKHSDNIKNLILDYEKKNPVGMDSNVKAWSSVYETHLLTDVFSSYIDAIVQFSQGLYNNIFSKEEILEVGELWVAHYRKGDFTQKHNHGTLLDTYLISGCYYAYVEDNASPIIFDGQKSIYPKSDSLILFSSQTEHEVPPTDGERIIMSFNIRKTTKTQLTTDDYNNVANFILNQ